jgi:cytochrome c
MMSICRCLSALALLMSSVIPSLSQDNSAPVVKITEPANKGKYSAGSQVSYQIKVSDKEDGESEYGEIATNEVFLEVKFVSDASKASTEIVADPVGLAAMKKSNCFSCHAFNGKLIAPSFHDIAKRYSVTAAPLDLLAKRVRDGSGGIWGTASMPSHTELTTQQTREIVDWILKNGKDENLNYYIGTEGSVRVKATEVGNQKGGVVFSATYSDHGSKSNAQQSLTSKDVIVLYLK